MCCFARRGGPRASLGRAERCSHRTTRSRGTPTYHRRECAAGDPDCRLGTTCRASDAIPSPDSLAWALDTPHTGARGDRRVGLAQLALLASIDTPIVVALVSAGASLVVAVLAQIGNRRTSVRLQRIEDERDERQARRDYEYEARKRLYQECEPLLFQAIELAEPAQSRVTGLARTARDGYLCADGSGWLESPGYYFTSTVYLLLAPVTVFRILQSRITSIDLGLDARLRSQYELLKLLFFSFNADFDLARTGTDPDAPAIPAPPTASEVTPSVPPATSRPEDSPEEPKRLEYEPDKTDPGEADADELLASSPQQFARQGLYRGTLDVIVQSLIVDGDAARCPRCMTYGEFLHDWDRNGSGLHEMQDTLIGLFGGFHPARKPVLWRVLIAQYLLYSALLRDTPVLAPIEPLTADRMKQLDWRRPPGDPWDAEVRDPVRAAGMYVQSKLEQAHARAAARGSRTIPQENPRRPRPRLARRAGASPRG